MASKAYQKRTRHKKVTCKKATALLGAYVRADLSPELNLLFEEHLRGCPDCVAFLTTYRKTIELAKEFFQADAAPRLARIRSGILDQREGIKASY